MRFLVPQGIGDSVWALHKVQSVRDALAPDEPIDIFLACGDASSLLETRALDFVRRFPFVSSAEMKLGGIHRSPPITARGLYNYIDDGIYDAAGESLCTLIPNAALERGVPLDRWLPQYPINWNIFDGFRIDANERAYATRLHAAIGDYAVFYPGPLNGNTLNGHNRNALWTPAEWRELGRRVHAEFHLPIVVVGAPYDASYYDSFLGPSLNGDSSHWTNLIGATNLGELYSVTSRAKFVISYQAGVGIVSTYLGTPTGIFWRPNGDSISPDSYLSFDEGMASAWVPPAAFLSRTHLPLIYRKHGVDYIMDQVRERGWAA